MQVIFKGSAREVLETEVSLYASTNSVSIEEALRQLYPANAHRYEVFEAELKAMFGHYPSEDEVNCCLSASGLDNAIARAEAKGQEVFKRIKRENVLLGIESATIDSRPATEVILERGANITSALTSGSTKAAIRYCKALPSTSKDATFLTDARLLSIVNELEAFHGMPLSTSLV